MKRSSFERRDFSGARDPRRDAPDLTRLSTPGPAAPSLLIFGEDVVLGVDEQVDEQGVHRLSSAFSGSGPGRSLVPTSSR
jgi:hypothetical protein